MAALSVLKHAGNFYEQGRTNNRLTALLVLVFLLYNLLLGYSLDVLFLKNDPLGLFRPASGRVPAAMLIALIVAATYTLYCFFRGEDLVLKSIKEGSASYGDDTPGLVRVWHDDTEHRQLVNVVGEIAIAAGIPMPSIYIVNDIDPNAFATGRDPRHASLAVTQGLLLKMDREELQAVVAHSMARIRNYDSRLMTLVATLSMGSILLVAWSGFRSLGKVLLLPLWLGLALFTALSVRALTLLIADERIYQADVTAVELTRNPAGVIRAMEELDFYTGATQSISPAIGHLCVMGPSGEYRRMDNAGFGYRFAVRAHPPMSKRIEALKEMAYILGSKPVQSSSPEA